MYQPNFNFSYYFSCEMTLSRPDGSQYDSSKDITLRRKTVQRICPRKSIIVKYRETFLFIWRAEQKIFIKKIYLRKYLGLNKITFFYLWIVYFRFICLGRIDSSWGSWNNWSQCSQTCGGGIKSRERNCDSGRGKCKGRSFESTICNKNQCKSNWWVMI